jgi:uncharacterized membrane protein YfcA
MYRQIIALLIGTIGGVVGGGLGLAGSAIMLPLLILSNIIPNYHKMAGTILFSVLPPISLLAVIEYGKRKQIDYLIGVLLFISYFFGAYYGAIINSNYTSNTLIYASSLTLFIVSLILFYIGYHHDGQK